MAEKDPDTAQEEPIFPDGFSVVGPLGEGATGRLWEATEVAHGRKVVLKMMKVLRAGDKYEGQVAARAGRAVEFRDKRSAQLYAVLQVEERVWSVRELIEGKSWQDILDRPKEARAYLKDDLFDRRGGVRLEHVVRWWVTLAEMLAAAHARGLVHGALRPTNIFVEKSLSPKVVDWGLASTPAESGGVAASAYAIRIRRFQAPEQSDSWLVPTPACDEYSLAACMLYLLSGREPSAPLPGGLESIDLRKESPTTPKYIIDVLDRCLSKEPARRHGTMEALLLSLEEAAGLLKAAGKTKIDLAAERPTVTVPTGEVTNAGHSVPLRKTGSATSPPRPAITPLPVTPTGARERTSMVSPVYQQRSLPPPRPQRPWLTRGVVLTIVISIAVLALVARIIYLAPAFMEAFNRGRAISQGKVPPPPSQAFGGGGGTPTPVPLDPIAGYYYGTIERQGRPLPTPLKMEILEPDNLGYRIRWMEGPIDSSEKVDFEYAVGDQGFCSFDLGGGRAVRFVGTARSGEFFGSLVIRVENGTRNPDEIRFGTFRMGRSNPVEAEGTTAPRATPAEGEEAESDARPLLWKPLFQAKAE